MSAQEASKGKRTVWLWALLTGLLMALAISTYVYFNSGESKPLAVVTPSPAIVASPPLPTEGTPAPPPAPDSDNVTTPEPDERAQTLQAAPKETSQPTPNNSTSRPSASKGPIHLDGSVYLFGNSISPARNYRMAYIVLNIGVAADNPYAGQVKSQVFRVLVDCKASRWGHDQLYYHARPFGEGERLFEKIWTIHDVKFKPLRDSKQDQRLKELMCR